jgi:hypothetical protein
MKRCASLRRKKQYHAKDAVIIDGKAKETHRIIQIFSREKALHGFHHVSLTEHKKKYALLERENKKSAALLELM